MLFTTTPAMLLAVASLQHGLLCSSSCCSEAGAAQAGRLITALLSSSSCGAAGTQRSQQQQMLHTSCTPAAAAAAAAPTPPPPQQQQQPTADKLRALLAANEQFVPRACARSGEPLSAQDRAALAAFRRFNISQPLLRNQVILAKVLKAGPKTLLVDPGYYGLNVVPRQELASATAHDASGRPIQRQSAAIHPGEFVKVRLAFFETPYGEAQLEPVSTSPDVRHKLVWEALAMRMNKGLTVQGRILNVTHNGFAVAVAGYVALLPHGQADAGQTRRIGVLQEFTIHSLDHKRRVMRLSGTKVRAVPQDMEEAYRRTL